MAAAVEGIAGAIEDAMGEGEEGIGELSKSAGEGGEVTEDLTSDLTNEQKEAFEEVQRQNTELNEVAFQEEAKPPDEEFDKAEKDGKLDEGKKKAELTEEEKKDLGASDKQAEGLTKRFTNKVKIFFSKLKSYMEGPVGQALIKSVGTVMKYWFICDMLKSTIKGVDQIVKDATDHSNSGLTSEQVQTKTKAVTFMSLVSALSHIVIGMKTTLETAAQFDAAGDVSDHTSGAYLAENITVRDCIAMKGTVSDAADACSAVLLNLKNVLKALGFTDGVTTEAFLEGILKDASKISAAATTLDVGKLQTFKEKISAMVKTTTEVIDRTYTDPQQKRTMTMFFKMPVLWKAREAALENFIMTVTAGHTAKS